MLKLQQPMQAIHRYANFSLKSCIFSMDFFHAHRDVVGIKNCALCEIDRFDFRR